MSLSLPQGMQITGKIEPGFERILTLPALELVAKLHRAFEPRRQELLKARGERARRLDAGERPDFLPETRSIREGDWLEVPYSLPEAAVRSGLSQYELLTLLGPRFVRSI